MLLIILAIQQVPFILTGNKLLQLPREDGENSSIEYNFEDL